jgi:hypothetical protein
LELDVIEDGPGFPRECLPRAWNRFSRAGWEAGCESKAPGPRHPDRRHAAALNVSISRLDGGHEGVGHRADADRRREGGRLGNEASHASTTAKPGQSRAELTVTDAAGNKSRTGSVGFRVLEEKKRSRR